MYQTTTSHQCYSQIFLTFMWEEIVFLYLSMYILDPCLAKLKYILRIYFEDSLMTLDIKNMQCELCISYDTKKSSISYHKLSVLIISYHQWVFHGDTFNSNIKENRLESIKLNFFLKINLRGRHSGCLRFGVSFYSLGNIYTMQLCSIGLVWNVIQLYRNCFSPV